MLILISLGEHWKAGTLGGLDTRIRQEGIAKSRNFIIGQLIRDYFNVLLYSNKFATAVTHIINIQIIRGPSLHLSGNSSHH